MTNQTFADICETDALAGESLQFMPEVYTHRRFLIERLDAYDKRVKELDELLGVGVNSLDELVTVVRERIEMQHANAAPFEAAERELHNPFQQAPTEMPVGWSCKYRQHHRVGEECNHTGPCL